MDNLVIYLLKVSGCLGIFYISYILFFSKDTFYFRNRILLILMLLLSYIIPVISIAKGQDVTVPLKQFGIIGNLINTGSGLDTALTREVGSISFMNILTLLYFIIVLILLLRLVQGIIKTMHIIRKGKTSDATGQRIIVSDLASSPFSFYKYVVVPVNVFNEGDYAEILEHEKIHVRQRHTFDLIFCEILSAVLWFNPFIWMTKRAILLNHEFLADRHVVNNSGDLKEYQYRLLNIKHNISLNYTSHNFSSLIKNRLVMINKKSTPRLATIKILLLVPVAFVLFAMLSFRSVSGPGLTSDQKQLFSNSSKNELLKFVAMNTGYPQESKNSSDTGSIYVSVKVGKGGIVKECNASTDLSSVKTPLLEQIVIVGYRNATAAKHVNDDHALLKAECIRISKKIGEVDIPEWKEKDLEFTLAIKFVLK